MAKTIHLIRHGQSTFNAHMSLTGEDPMTFDAPLSPKGEQQVKALSREVAALPVDLVVSTPFTRAIQTSIGAFGARGLPMVIEPLHREHLAASCDVGSSPLRLAEAFPELDFGHLADPWWYVKAGHHGPFAEEPHDELMQRVNRFRGWLASRPERRIAVVGHGTFFYMLIGRFLNNAEVAKLEL
ncbi:MAG: histidine phosphatase family protein [Minwuia sp.]|uniref:histidine phosphatase family protein n=1 Tax=Minwuia sp. TaxID=2493630 RepID=UPI003A843490